MAPGGTAQVEAYKAGVIPYFFKLMGPACARREWDASGFHQCAQNQMDRTSKTF